jgi:glycosyltransferase involved in cell wall biosynthesis
VESMTTPLVSVIIPALNEERVIGKCLESLTRLDPLASGFEVLVVDNGSTDDTVTIARTFASVLDLRVLQAAKVTISALRNLGASHARGRYLAFLDADCLAPAGWLSEAVSAFSDHPPAVLGAHYRIPPGSSWVARAWYAHHGVKSGSVSYIPGGDIFIARSDFESVGGFDPTLETNEDYEFCQRARAAGLAILALAPLAVCHLGTPQTLRDFYRKQRWHGRHVFRVFFRSLPRLRNLSAVAFAVYTLLCLTGLAAGFVAVFLAQSPLWLLLFAAALIVAPAFLSFRKAASRGDLSLLPPLALLFLTFGFARAACLLGLAAQRGSRAKAIL